MNVLYLLCRFRQRCSVLENSTAEVIFGKNAENPLSLLGQYSDDELDDVSNKTKDELYDNKQAIEPISEQLEEGEVGGNDDLACQKAEGQYRQRDSASANTSQVVDPVDLMNNMVAAGEIDYNVDGEKQDPVLMVSETSGHLTTSWKMVFHEESNRYYYWNTVSGETSWEIPEGLVHGTELTDGLQCSRMDMQENASGDVYNATAFGVSVDDFSAGHGVGYTNVVSQMKVGYEQIAPESQFLEQSKGDDEQLLGSSLVVGALPCETSTLSNYVLPENYNGCVESLSMGNYAVEGQNVPSTKQSTHLPSHLAKKCETLLENLKGLLGSGIDPGRHVLLSRYISELELRLSDIRTLVPYESSLLPFWVHIERHLDQLENSTNSEIGKPDIKISGTYMNPSGENYVQPKGTGDDRMLPPENDVDALVEAVMRSHDEVSNVGTSMSDFIAHSDPDLEGGTKVSDTALDEKASSKLESQADEDVDMDIDMEVEAPNPVKNRSVDSGDQFEDIPPPSEDEWIPPPPPDDEGIPPPPPDEPDDSLCPPPPPSELETEQSMYSEQYNMGYAEPNVNYYGGTSSVSSGSSFFEQAGSSQIAGLDLPIYFSTAQQPIAASSPADAVVYYGLQNGPLPAAPLADTIGSFSSQAAASFPGCDTSCTEMTLADASAGVCSLPKQIVNPLATSSMSGAFLSHGSSASVVSAPATVSDKHVSAPSSSTETAATASEASSLSKAQSKASRMKKPKVSVGSSLRSNKKVSSLVDKWKAAKEELEDEEERYESPLEILEKKRQREIEDWRAQQLASGVAKENANFQPLGGNWRERVKRKRAQKGAAATETPSNSSNEGIKQPDLKALSKGLPIGWQVYWDDSSRQVYYSNSRTSETTWTRPT